jgi:hypothetical protein
MSVDRFKPTGYNESSGEAESALLKINSPRNNQPTKHTLRLNAHQYTWYRALMSLSSINLPVLKKQLAFTPMPQKTYR